MLLFSPCRHCCSSQPSFTAAGGESGSGNLPPAEQEKVSLEHPGNGSGGGDDGVGDIEGYGDDGSGCGRDGGLSDSDAVILLCCPDVLQRTLRWILELIPQQTAFSLKV